MNTRNEWRIRWLAERIAITTKNIGLACRNIVFIAVSKPCDDPIEHVEAWAEHLIHSEYEEVVESWPQLQSTAYAKARRYAENVYGPILARAGCFFHGRTADRCLQWNRDEAMIFLSLLRNEFSRRGICAFSADGAHQDLAMFWPPELESYLDVLSEKEFSPYPLPDISSSLAEEGDAFRDYFDEEYSFLVCLSLLRWFCNCMRQLPTDLQRHLDEMDLLRTGAVKTG